MDLKQSNDEIFSKLTDIYCNWQTKASWDIIREGNNRGEEAFEKAVIKYISETISELEILLDKIIKRKRHESNQRLKDI